MRWLLAQDIDSNLYWLYNWPLLFLIDNIRWRNLEARSKSNSIPSYWDCCLVVSTSAIIWLFRLVADDWLIDLSHQTIKKSVNQSSDDRFWRVWWLQSFESTHFWWPACWTASDQQCNRPINQSLLTPQKCLKVNWYMASLTRVSDLVWKIQAMLRVSDLLTLHTQNDSMLVYQMICPSYITAYAVNQSISTSVLSSLSLWSTSWFSDPVGNMKWGDHTMDNWWHHLRYLIGRSLQQTIINSCIHRLDWPADLECIYFSVSKYMLAVLSQLLNILSVSC